MAKWKVDAETKSATLDIYGGVLTVTRSDAGVLGSTWVRPYQDGENEGRDAEGGLGEIRTKTQLHDQTRVAGAQAAAIERLTESLRRTHPAILAQYEGSSAEDGAGEDKPDPF